MGRMARPIVNLILCLHRSRWTLAMKFKFIQQRVTQYIRLNWIEVAVTRWPVGAGRFHHRVLESLGDKNLIPRPHSVLSLPNPSQRLHSLIGSCRHYATNRCQRQHLLVLVSILNRLEKTSALYPFSIWQVEYHSRDTVVCCGGRNRGVTTFFTFETSSRLRMWYIAYYHE